MAINSLVAETAADMADIASQIRQLWGGYGDWNQGGIDRAEELARLFADNGITDLSKLSLKTTTETIPGQRNSGDGGDGADPLPETRTGRALFYDGNQLGYLGDVNNDNSLNVYKPPPAGVPVFDAIGPALNMMKGGEGTVGWSSRGHGGVSFMPFELPNGGYGIAPVWGSSSQDDFETARGIASIAALAAGAYYAPAGGTAGAMAQGGLKGAAMAMGGNMVANPNGSVDSLVKSGLKGGVTGAAGAGVGQYAQQAGWSPATTGAVKGATGAALGGGNGGDILKGALTGGAGSYANGLQLTDDPAMNRAILAGGTSLLKGNGAGAALGSAAMGYFGGGSPSTTHGTNMGDFADFSNWYNSDTPSWGSLDTGGDLWNQYYGDGSNYANWQQNYDPTQFGGYQPVFDSEGNLTGVTGTETPAGGGSNVNLGSLAKLLGGNGGALLGAGLGALGSKSQTQTSTRDPWSAAQPFLKQQLAQGSQLSNQYAAQPFSQAQQNAYGNVGGLLDYINGNAGGLMANAGAVGQNQFRRGMYQPTQFQGIGAPAQYGLLGNFGTKG